MSSNVIQYFAEIASMYPDCPALVQEDQKITFTELYNNTIQTAAHFKEKGINQGDRVLIFVPMGIDLYRILSAIFYLGATAVFIEQWLDIKKINKALQVVDCKALICNFKFRMLGILSREIRRIPLKLGISYQEDLLIPEAYESKPTDTALITFTTGSTGLPKAANRTHQFLNEQFNALLIKLQTKAHEVELVTLPIVLLVNLGIGACSVIVKPFSKISNDAYFKSILQTIQSKKVNRICASPHFLIELALYAKRSGISMNQISKVFTGGGPVSIENAKQLLGVFRNANIQIIYGSTEAEPISSIDAFDLAKNSGNEDNGICVGAIFQFTTVKIIKISQAPCILSEGQVLNELELKTGEIGEIIVSGPHVLNDYYNSPEALKMFKILDENNIVWHRTGDVGYMDEKKMLYLCGRTENIFEINGEYASQYSIENFFNHSDFFESGTIMKEGDLLIAAIVLKKSANPLKGIQHVQENYPWLNGIIILKNLWWDKRHHSKIDYKKLRKLIQEKIKKKKDIVFFSNNK